MTFIQAIVLGIVQGITEFLPISSSGHLVLIQKLWHITEGGPLFVTLLHIGTLFAVIFAMRKEVLWLWQHPKSRVTWMLLIALLPTAVVGVLFEEWFDRLFETGATIGFEFIITGCVLWWMDSCQNGKKNENTMQLSDSLWIGTFQGAAILPALSRSGLTIAAGLWRGMDRDAAGRFSFLLSIPAILGGMLVELDDLFEHPEQIHALPWIAMLVGALAALISGYLSVKWTLWLLRKSRMRIFAVYVWILAVFVLSDQLFFHHWFPSLI